MTTIQPPYASDTAPQNGYAPVPYGYAQPVVEDKVETLAPVSPLITKYNLEEVQIGHSEREPLRKANEFIVYFKKRLNQFLVSNNRIESEIEMPHSIAGGYLSDSYMKTVSGINSHLYGYKRNENALNSRDMDLFLQIPVEHFKALDMELFKRQIEKELIGDSQRYVRVSSKTYEQSAAYVFLSIPYIFEISLPGMPSMEIIVCNDLERIMDFDISIRHFFNFGDNKVYAPKFAIESIEKKELVVVCPITPKSTLVRLFYFKRRYGFSIDTRSISLLTWMFKEKYMSAEDLIQYATNVDKFEHDQEMKSYIYTHVHAYLETYTTARRDQVLRKELSGYDFHSFLYSSPVDDNYQNVKPKQTVSYFGEFESNFPYSDIFYSVYRFISHNNIYDVLFSNQFPHGFFGKFYPYIHGHMTTLQFLEDCGEEFLELLKKCQTQWPSLYIEYEEAEQNKSEYAKEVEEAEFLADLQRMFDRNPEMANKHISRRTKKRLRAGGHYSRVPEIQLDTELFPAEDLPAFLVPATKQVAPPQYQPPVKSIPTPYHTTIDGLRDEDLPF